MSWNQLTGILRICYRLFTDYCHVRLGVLKRRKVLQCKDNKYRNVPYCAVWSCLARKGKVRQGIFVLGRDVLSCDELPGKEFLRCVAEL